MQLTDSERGEKDNFLDNQSPHALISGNIATKRPEKKIRTRNQNLEWCTAVRRISKFRAPADAQKLFDYDVVDFIGWMWLTSSVVDFMGAQQEKASKKIAELEDMKRMIDVQRTPAAKARDGSRFNSAKDDLKAQLSSIKAGLAASSSESKYALDAGDVSAKVRDQLSQLHDAVDQVCLTSLHNGPPLRIRARSGRALQRDAAAHHAGCLCTPESNLSSLFEQENQQIFFSKK